MSNNNNDNPFANINHLNELVQQNVQDFYLNNNITTDQQKKKLVQHKVILPNEIDKGQNYNNRHNILTTIRSTVVGNVGIYTVMKNTSNPWTTYSVTNGHTNGPRRVGTQ